MKARASKLDAHRDDLLAWLTQKPGGEGLTLEAALARLKERHGVSSSRSRLSVWLAAQQQAAMQERILGQITSGAMLGRDIEKRFEKHPAPETAQLVKLLRVLVMQLSVQSSADPTLLELVNPLMRSILDFLKTEQKAEQIKLDERRVVLLEQKAAQADKVKLVLAEKLTPEQEQLELRKIFGMT